LFAFHKIKTYLSLLLISYSMLLINRLDRRYASNNFPHWHN